MTSDQHVTELECDRLRDGTLAPADVARIGQHSLTCAQCQWLLHERAPLDRMFGDLRAQIEAADEAEHLSDEALMSYADGLRPLPDHLRDCAACAREVEELLEVRRSVRPPQRWPYAAGAVAAAALIVIVWLVPFRSQHPDPAPPAPRPRPGAPVPVPAPPVRTDGVYGRADWNEWVAEARTRRRLTLPRVIRELQGSPDSLRGARAEDDQRLAPHGTAVASTRPQFQWKAVDGATYRVILQAANGSIVESEMLTRPSWVPPRALDRGREYAWQLEIVDGASRTLHPAAPDPPARFRIVEQSVLEEIEGARSRFPADPLLHAVLLARFGLRDDAWEALKTLEKSDPTLAGALRESLASDSEGTTSPR